MTTFSGGLQDWKPPVPIWDAHMHVERLPGHSWDSPPERILKQMDPLGIEKAAIMTYTDITHDNAELLDELAQDAEAFAGRFLLFARIHPGEGAGAAELLEHAVKNLGYVGLKLHTVTNRIHPTDPRTVTLVRKAAQLGIPTLFHSGDEELALPEDIGPLAEKVPEATIIMGHAGGYFHVASSNEWARRCPNIVIDISATPDIRNLLKGLDALGPGRFVYASDGPGCPPHLDLVKTRFLLSKGYEAEAADVLRDNFRRILPPQAGADA